MIVREPYGAFGDPPVLQQGASGNPVTQLQTDLSVLGFLPASGIDGSFGPDTLAALQAFQTASSIPVTGIADAATWTSLASQLPTAWIDPTTGTTTGETFTTKAAATVASVPLIGPSMVTTGGGFNWPVVAGISAVALGGAMVLWNLFRKRPQEVTA